MSDAAPPPRDQVREATILRQVQEALAASNVAGAIEIARKALSDGFAHPMLLNLRSFWLEQQGRDDDALADLALAVSMAAGDPLVSNAYGLQLAKMNRRAESVAAFQKTISLDPNFAPAHFNLGWANEAVGDLEGSRRSHERAIALNPKFPQALAHLANLAARRGDWDQARGFADRALELDPGELLALRAKATAAVAEGQFDDAERFIARIMGDPRVPVLDRAIADSVLGDLRHAQSRYAEAFAAYRDG
ncbi:MAG TPA: tetratricopeptide repeat protein, partial [Rhizomicrobium sp.]